MQLIYSWWEYKMIQLLWKQFWQNTYLFSKVKYIITLWSSSFTPEYLPKRNENISIQGLIYKYHNTVIYSNQNLETTQIFSNRWGGKQLGYIRAKEYHYPAIKRKEVLRHSTWMDFKTIFLSKRRQTQKSTYYMIPSIWNPRKGKTSL